MAQGGEALLGPCDDSRSPTSPPRHRTSPYPLHTLTYFIALMVAAEKRGESASDKHLHTCIPIAPEVRMGLHLRPLFFSCISFMGPHLAVGQLSR
jgi:hypothetical protein